MFCAVFCGAPLVPWAPLYKEHQGERFEAAGEAHFPLALFLLLPLAYRTVFLQGIVPVFLDLEIQLKEHLCTLV